MDSTFTSWNIRTPRLIRERFPLCSGDAQCDRLAKLFMFLLTFYPACFATQE